MPYTEPFGPCCSCGKEPSPIGILRGFHPCACIVGHLYQRCEVDRGGCGTVSYFPPIDEAAGCSSDHQ